LEKGIRYRLAKGGQKKTNVPRKVRQVRGCDECERKIGGGRKTKKRRETIQLQTKVHRGRRQKAVKGTQTRKFEGGKKRTTRHKKKHHEEEKTR